MRGVKYPLSAADTTVSLREVPRASLQNLSDDELRNRRLKLPARGFVVIIPRISVQAIFNDCTFGGFELHDREM